MAYANSAEVSTVCHFTKYLKKQLHKKQNLGQKATLALSGFTVYIMYYNQFPYDQTKAYAINPCHAE